MRLKVGIDFGASRIKVSFKDKNGKIINVQFPNRFLVGENNTSTSGTIVVRTDVERTNRVGSTNGTANMEKVKLNYSYLDDIILVVAKKMKDALKADKYITLDIETLLPPEQYLSITDAFKDKIKAFGKITGTVMGDEIVVEIGEVGVSCEGVALLNSVDLNALCGEVEKCLLVDAGSSTVDFVAIEKVDGAWEIVDAGTDDKVGGSVVLGEIAAGLRKKYPTQKFEYDKLEKDMYYLIGEEKHLIKDDISFADDKIEGLSKAFNKYYIGGKVLVSGGAGELLMESTMFMSIIPQGVKPVLVPESARTFGNSLGAYNS